MDEDKETEKLLYEKMVGLDDIKDHIKQNKTDIIKEKKQEQKQ